VRNNGPGRRILTGLMLLLGAVLYCAGLVWPTVTTKSFLFREKTHSILSAILTLLRDGDLALFSVLLLFTIVFPILKIVVVASLFISRPRSAQSEALHNALYHLGKWSMVDVFVIAVTIVLLRAGTWLKVRVNWGIIMFACSVVLINVATLLLGREERKGEGADEPQGSS